MAADQVADQLLVTGLDDWVHFADVFWTARNLGSTEDVVASALEAIRQLLEGGLVEVGDVARGSGFQAWDLETSAALNRIEREWRSLGRDPYPGDIGWLRSTPSGKRRGQDVLAQQGRA